MPIFCVKPVKIYTGQKNFTWIYSWRSWQIWGMETLEFFSITYSNTCAPTEHHSWLGLALTCKPTKISDVATTLWLRSRSCFLAILAFAPCRYPVCWKNNNYIIPYDEPLMRFSLRSYLKPFPHLLRHQYVAKKFPFHECEVC